MALQLITQIAMVVVVAPSPLPEVNSGIVLLALSFFI